MGSEREEGLAIVSEQLGNLSVRIHNLIPGFLYVVNTQGRVVGGRLVEPQLTLGGIKGAPILYVYYRHFIRLEFEVRGSQVDREGGAVAVLINGFRIQTTGVVQDLPGSLPLVGSGRQQVLLGR